ncbi:hypothetical protein CC80DRAFT_592776 [Byssothecium circinans]|uniref:Uncharacterized protein n=1 Tax=Byssothecium circinans TaxID=147558 RepID=A0A6A5U3H3_9PLEO|nr:hypothetical protein CC80DRAFT_592776 [Byssothecium circinans]
MDRPVDVPSYAHLNRAQKRIFIIRDELKFLDPLHLDTFLSGISEPEPPNFRLTNASVQPPLTDITLKESATQVDLGNVRFREAAKSIVRRVHLYIEDGRCEMRESEALPEEEANLDSVPIDVYLIKSTVTLFQAKFEAVDKRCRQLNEVRKAAYAAAMKTKTPVAPVGQGKSLEKLNVDEFAPDGNVSSETPTRKRLPGEPILKHVANKRRRIGFDQVPNFIKCDVFSSISAQTKIDLFDTLLKTAMPRFDDLMMACWNVAGVYNGTGTECAELHRVVYQMIEVLKEFDESFRDSERKMGIARGLQERGRLIAKNANAYGREEAATPVDGRVAGSGAGAAQQHRSQGRVARDSRNAEDEASYSRTVDARRSDNHHPQEQSKLKSALEASERQDAALSRRRAHVDHAMDPHPGYHNGTPAWGYEAYGPNPYTQEYYPGHAYYGYTPNHGRDHEPDDRQYPIRDTKRKQQQQQQQQQDAHPRSSSQTTHRPAKPAPEDRDRVVYTDGAAERFEDHQQQQQQPEDQGDQDQDDEGNGNSAPPTLPVKKEKRVQDKERERNRPEAPTTGVFLGQSKLGAPKKPQGATIRAPVAPMVPGQQVPTAPMARVQTPR